MDDNADLCSYRLFCIEELAEVTGHPRDQSRATSGVPVLASRLLDLLSAAGFGCLDLTRRAHDLASDQHDALRAAAAHFALLGGTVLDQVLWLDLGSLRNGTIADALRRVQAKNQRTVGFLLLCADSICSRAAYFRHSRPLSVRDGIQGDLDIEGPFLVMLKCELDFPGQVIVTRGFAQPVQSHRFMFPVRSAIERDLVTVLMVVQEKMDQYGMALAIDRNLENGSVAPQITARLSNASGTLREVRFNCDRQMPDDDPARSLSVDRASIRDGRLVRQIAEAFLSP